LAILDAARSFVVLKLDHTMRIQTVLLAIAVVALGLSIGLDFWQKIDPTTGEKVVLSGLSMTHSPVGKAPQGQSGFGLVALTLIAIVLAGYSAVVSLSAKPDRLRQLLLGAINSLVIAGVLGLMFFQVFKKAMPLFSPSLAGQYLPGFYLAVLALLCNMIANRLIRRDQALVEKSDRMR
jgi:Domain of unknown function (DUF4293)